MPKLLPDPAFVVAICGSAFGWETQWPTASCVDASWSSSYRLFDAPLSTPSLHLIGVSDPLKLSSEKLAGLFASPRITTFTSGHKPPTQKAAAVSLASFLKDAALGKS